MPNYTRTNTFSQIKGTLQKSVRVATTATVTLGAAPNTLDGVTLAAGDRILVKNQSTGSQNGIYYITTLGTGSNGIWSRAFDFQTSDDSLNGILIYVSEGTSNQKTIWFLTTVSPIVLDTTALVFEKLTAPSTASLGTGILKSTTSTGALSIAVAGDFPTLNQNTTGSAATLTTPRSIYGNNFDGSAALTQIIGAAFGGTGNGFTAFSGPASSTKTFTLPNASATILTDNAVVTSAQGGTGVNNGGRTLTVNTNNFTVASSNQANTLTLANNLTTAGNFALTLTTTASTNVTLPTTGTLVTLAGSETLTNKNLTSGTNTFPTFNQNTTGSAGSISASNVITNANLSQVATATFKGRVTASTGNVEDMTATQATSLLNTFTTSLKGLAPASGGGTTNYLRADGTWAAPSSSQWTTSGSAVYYNNPVWIGATTNNGGTSANLQVTGNSWVSGSLLVGSNTLLDSAYNLQVKAVGQTTFAAFANDDNNSNTIQYRAIKTKAGSYNLGSNQIIFDLNAQADLGRLMMISSANLWGSYSTVDLEYRAYNAAGTSGTKLKVTAEGITMINTATDDSSGATFQVNGKATFTLGSGTDAVWVKHATGGQLVIGSTGTSNVSLINDATNPRLAGPSSVPFYIGVAGDSISLFTKFLNGGGMEMAGATNFKNNTIEGYSSKFNDQTGTTYTLQSSDNGKTVTCNNASAITVTVPSGLPAGFNCMIFQKGAGQITLAASSTTINNPDGYNKTAKQYAMITLMMYTTDTFLSGGYMI